MIHDPWSMREQWCQCGFIVLEHKLQLARYLQGLPSALVVNFETSNLHPYYVIISKTVYPMRTPADCVEDICITVVLRVPFMEFVLCHFRQMPTSCVRGPILASLRSRLCWLSQLVSSWSTQGFLSYGSRDATGGVNSSLWFASKSFLWPWELKKIWSGVVCRSPNFVYDSSVPFPTWIQDLFQMPDINAVRLPFFVLFFHPYAGDDVNHSLTHSWRKVSQSCLTFVR